jgi:hypothetical protein
VLASRSRTKAALDLSSRCVAASPPRVRRFESRGYSRHETDRGNVIRTRPKRTIVVIGVFAALGAAAVPVVSDAAVYGGSLGALTAPLGPDGFYITADSGRLTGIGLTRIVACTPSAVPLTLATSRVTPSSGAPDPYDVPVTERNTGGRFVARLSEPGPEGGRIQFDITGRFTSRHASGALPFRILKSDGTQACDGSTAPWRADRRPGRIFGGGMPGAGTVVLNRMGKSDMRFHLTVLTTDCGGGPPWLVPNS